MHNRKPPSQTGWPSLNLVIFPPLLRLVQDYKNSYHPEFIEQIHELNLEDCLISAKSLAENLGISRVRIVSIIHEDLNRRKLSSKWVPKLLKEN